MLTQRLTMTTAYKYPSLETSLSDSEALSGNISQEHLVGNVFRAATRVFREMALAEALRALEQR